MKITAVQMNSQDNVEENLASVENFVREAKVSEQAEMIVLPEYFAFVHDDVKRRRASGEAFPYIAKRLAALAKQYQVHIHAGSIVEPSGDRAYNTTLAFNPEGEEIARYRKLHLFDYESPEGAHHRESDFVARGDEVVTYSIGDLTVGCTICYDIRFPELFRKLRDKGADVIMLPAAFTVPTGRAHWEILLRARAIETQTYIFASGQTLFAAEGRRQCWGHSMIIDPWGQVLEERAEDVGLISAKIDTALIARIRQSMPIANHRVVV